MVGGSPLLFFGGVLCVALLCTCVTLSRPTPSLHLVLSRQAGVDERLAQHCLAASSTDVVKEALRATTDRAVALGAFGAPTMFMTTSGADGSLPPLDFPVDVNGAAGTTSHGELFFGSDRIEQIAALYGLPFHGTYTAGGRK